MLSTVLRRSPGCPLPLLLLLAGAGCEDAGIIGLGSVILVDGTPAAPVEGQNAQCTAGNIDFGAVEVGSQKTQHVSITNAGTQALRVSAVAVEEGQPDAQFSVAPLDEDLVLAPGESRRVPVVYAPTARGAATATLRIDSDNDTCRGTRVGLRGTGDAGEIEVCLTSPEGAETCNTPGAPLVVAFGLVPVGEARVWNGVVKALGSIATRVHTVRATGLSGNVATDLPPGQQGGDAALVVESGDEHRFTLTFTPRSGRPESGTLSLATNDDDENPVDIQITGQGDAPAICGDPLSLDFGSVPVGSDAEGVFTISSCGTRPLDVEAPALGAGTSDDFTLVGAQSAHPGMLPGESFEIHVRYHPADIGRDRGAVTIRSSDPIAGEVSLSLQGGSEPPDACILAVNFPVVDFGAIANGVTVSREIVISNAGTFECSLTAIEGPAPAGPFALAMQPDLPAVIAPGAGVRASVSYTPNDAGAHRAELALVSDDPITPRLTVQLMGTGGAAAMCNIEIDPRGALLADGHLNFGEVNLGTTATRPIRLLNRGSAPCEVVRTEYRCNRFLGGITGQCTNPPFTVVPPARATFGPGERVEVQVTFTPHGLGPVGIGIPGFDSIIHAVVIETTDPDQMTRARGFPNPYPVGTFVVGLGGSAVEADIEVIPRELDFGVITTGCRSPETCVTVYNVGSANLNVTSLRVDGAAAARFTIARVSAGAGQNVNFPYVVTGGQRFDVCLTYRPGVQSGVEQAELVIQSDDANEPEVRVPLRGEATTSSHQTDVFRQLDEPKVDVLFVIDNSGSMSEEQNNVATNFNAFIAAADASNVDYQIGVISTEVNEAGGIGTRNGIAPGILFPGNSGDRVITRRTPNRASVFADHVNVGECCSDEQEAGLKAAQLALEDPPPAENAGFVRPDAKLSIIFVSDEAEQSNGPVDFYVDFFKAIKGFRNDALMDASAIVGDEPSGCNGSGGVADNGARYIEVVNRTGGLFRSICTTSWGRDLADLGVLAFGVQVEFILSRQAAPAGLVVRVNGQRVAAGWTYDGQTNSIIFADTAVPPRGAQITVDYDVVCLR